MSIAYNVYRNDGAGGPIDYSNPITTTTALSWSIGPLEHPGAWKFAVRTVRVEDGLEERNLSVAAVLILDSSGRDASRRPASPTGLRVFPRAAGAIRVEWSFHDANRARAPIGFRIYIGAGGPPNYTAAAATVSFASGRATYHADLFGLISGTSYFIAVRAFNEAGEEENAASAAATADAEGPAAVDALTATTSSEQGDSS